MAIDIPALGGKDFKEKLEKAIEKTVSLLRSKCVDGQMYRSDFELEVNSIFRKEGLTAETADYENIEMELNNLDCTIEERFKTFDKFKPNT